MSPLFSISCPFIATAGSQANFRVECVNAESWTCLVTCNTAALSAGAFLSANKKAGKCGRNGRGRMGCGMDRGSWMGDQAASSPPEMSKELFLAQPDAPSLFPNLALHFTCITRTVMNFSASIRFYVKIVSKTTENRGHERQMMAMMRRGSAGRFSRLPSVVALNARIMQPDLLLPDRMHLAHSFRLIRERESCSGINTLTGGRRVTY